MSTILLVEDEPDLRAVLAEILREEGYSVVTAGTGQAALDAMAQTPPDLVLMDVMMPGMDGRITYVAMRGRPEGAAIPIVLMSATVRSARLPDGIDGFLRKPFDLNQVLALVAMLIGPSSSSD